MLIAPPAFSAANLHDVLRDSNGYVVQNSFGNCVRTQWMTKRDACAPGRAIRSAQRIGQEERTVYFGFNKTSLTPESSARLDSLAHTLKSDQQVKQANIIGFADRIGNASYNEQLSKRRAGVVRQYLISRGFVNSRVANTRWLGESTPVTNCPDTLTRAQLIDCLRRDRRVELEIDYFPDTWRRSN